MSWDPSVLRKYSSTSHFRLLNQVRSELKGSPLIRNSDGGLSLGMGRKAPNFRVPVERRISDASTTISRPVSQPLLEESQQPAETDALSFRERLRAIEMR